MCGIAGYFTKPEPESASQDEASLRAALAAIRHRGPDAYGVWHGLTATCRIGLGHVRLSILDLSDGANQPFVSDDGRVVLVYNGEVYNFAALRRELAAAGALFRTSSDTEVLLQAYRHWGKDCLARLEGMFAFVLVDLQRNVALLARDPFGVKPLYYAVDAGGGLVFGSELKAIAALHGHRLRPAPEFFAEFLLNGFLYEPSTGFEGVAKLAPGMCAEYDFATSSLSLSSYHDHVNEPPPRGRGFPELLQESMTLQCVADVPIGLFFSGGTDSTALAIAAPRPLDALYVEYGESASLSDTAYATAVADELGLEMRVISMRPEDQLGPDSILDGFATVAQQTEEPISDYTYLAASAIAQVARSRGFKVMLSGMGGDEFFAGYPRHLLARYRRLARAASPLLTRATGILESRPGMAKKAARLARFVDDADFGMAYTSLVGYFSVAEVDALLGGRDELDAYRKRLDAILEPARAKSHLKQAMLLDRFGYLAHNLTVTDRSSMAHGLEVRVPLMSKELGAFGATLPDHELIRGRRTKLPLKRYAERRLPRELVHRPKVGFNPPLDEKIASLGEARIRRSLREGASSSLLNPRAVDSIVSEHFEGRANNTYKLWQLLYFDFWLATHSS